MPLMYAKGMTASLRNKTGKSLGEWGKLLSSKVFRDKEDVREFLLKEGMYPEFIGFIFWTSHSRIKYEEHPVMLPKKNASAKKIVQEQDGMKEAMTNDNKADTSTAKKPQRCTLSQEEMEDIMAKVIARSGQSNIKLVRMSDKKVSQDIPKEVTFMMKSRSVKIDEKQATPKPEAGDGMLKNEVPLPIEDIRDYKVRNKRGGSSEIQQKLRTAATLKEDVYFDNDWEESVHRFDHVLSVYFTKFKGWKEFQAHPDSEFVWQGHSNGAGILITKEEYEAY